MLSRFALRSKKAGMAPGSLIYLGHAPKTKPRVSLVHYSKDNLFEPPPLELEECLSFLKLPGVTWIDIQGIHDPETMEAIGCHFGLHPLLLEDIMNPTQRSKLDDYQNTLFIVSRFLLYDEKGEEIVDEQVSFVLGPHFLLTFFEKEDKLFNPIKERIRSGLNRFRENGPDYLCYALLDCLVDHYFVLLDQLNTKMEKLDEELINRPEPATLHRIQRLKRDILHLRKAIWPMREVIGQFRRLESSLVKEGTKLFLHDIYDHIIQSVETLESFRDIAAGMLEVYLSNISMRMNEVMKVLTVVSTIFVPLTFIASIYGMNFEMIPELEWKYGYPVVLSVMFLMTLLMLHYFRKKKWI